jgi:hypothetical protein
LKIIKLKKNKSIKKLKKKKEKRKKRRGVAHGSPWGGRSPHFGHAKVGTTVNITIEHWILLLPSFPGFNGNYY